MIRDQGLGIRRLPEQPRGDAEPKKTESEQEWHWSARKLETEYGSD